MRISQQSESVDEENMPSDFITKLKKAAAKRDSWLCVGLDPVRERMPDGISEDASGIVTFCEQIIEATAPYAAAFKPNIAFFETLGREGWAALSEVCDAVPQDIPIILDAKRGDIGNTADRYAEAYYDILGVDAVTVNPYMGWDAVKPFATWPGKAAFVLCLTSNASASELQSLPIADEQCEPLFHRVARLVASWEGTCGLVVGATKAEHIAEVRKLAPNAPLLIPGVGAQGGDLAASVRNGAWKGGGGALINASRSILYASSEANFAEAAAREAERLCVELRRAQPR